MGSVGQLPTVHLRSGICQWIEEIFGILEQEQERIRKITEWCARCALEIFQLRCWTEDHNRQILTGKAFESFVLNGQAFSPSCNRKLKGEVKIGEVTKPFESDRSLCPTGFIDCLMNPISFFYWTTFGFKVNDQLYSRSQRTGVN